MKASAVRRSKVEAKRSRPVSLLNLRKGRHSAGHRRRTSCGYSSPGSAVDDAAVEMGPAEISRRGDATRTTASFIPLPRLRLSTAGAGRRRKNNAIVERWMIGRL